MEKLFWRLGCVKTQTNPLHPQLDCMVDKYMKTVAEYKWMVFLVYQRNWNESLPLLLLAYKASTNEITSTTHTSIVSGKLTCVLGQGEEVALQTFAHCCYARRY
jgi:hypothetical protein